MKVFGSEGIIPTDAGFSPCPEHSLAGQEMARSPTLRGSTLVVTQGNRPGDVVFQILHTPYMQPSLVPTSAPYISPNKSDIAA